MKKGFWNYSEPITYRALRIKLLPVHKPPMHWQNAFAGQERQILELTHGVCIWHIDNEDGSGLKKILAGGGPDSFHRSVSDFEFIATVKDEDINQFDAAKCYEINHLEDKWAMENHPEEHKRIMALRQSIHEMRKARK